MKKFFKFSMACLLVLCSCFTFVACGKKDDESAKINEANYIVLKSSSAKTTNVDNYENGITTIGINKSSMGVTVDRTTGIDKDTADALEKEVKQEIGDQNQQDRTVISYDKTNQKGYVVMQELAEAPEASGGEDPVTTGTTGDATQSSEVWENYAVNFFEKAGDDYNVYQYQVEDESDGYSKYLADANFSIRYSQGLEEMYAELAEMFIGYDTYAQLVGDISAELLENSMDGIPVSNVTPVVGFTEKDGIYTLSITLDFTIPNMEMGEVTMDAVVDVDASVVFDKDRVYSMGYTILMTGEVNMSLSDSNDDKDSITPDNSQNSVTATSTTEGAPDNNTIKINFAYSMEQSITFTDGYNQEFEPEIEGKNSLESQGGYPISVEFYINGYQLDNGLYKATGDAVNSDELKNIIENAKTSANIKWYVDEACTQEFDATKYSSYDIKLYTKNVELETGYAYLIRVGISSENFSGMPSASDIEEILEDCCVEVVEASSITKESGYTYILNGALVTGDTITLLPNIVNILIELS